MRELAADVAAFIDSPDGADDERFNALALRVFEHQYAHLNVVQRMADRAGKTPDTVTRWQDIPAVPTVAFKQFDLFTGEESEVAQVFESSGTSGAARSRSLFSGEGLELMDRAIAVNASRMLLNDGRKTRILVLAPAPELAPQMIMAWGMERLIEHFGVEGSRFLIGRDGLDTDGLVATLISSAEDDVPITLIGASFGFVHLLDAFGEQGARFYCAPGSRAMDAGGFKGRSREVSRAWLERSVSDRLEIAPDRCVNLLGMTELPSQFYDGVLAAGTTENRRKVNPHWTRTRVLDPTSRRPTVLGERGLLWHLDLTNIERPMVLQTDDLGLVDEHGWDIIGRAAGSDAKGCSLTVEEMLRPKLVPLRKQDDT